MVRKLCIEKYERTRHWQDIESLAKHMRPQDVAELEACGYASAKQALFASLDFADLAFVAKTPEGAVLCAFGLSAARDAFGAPIWCLGATALQGYEREFMVYSKRILERWQREFGRLYNYVSVDNDKALRWLRWLGAAFSEPFAYGANGEFFILFTLGGNKYVCGSEVLPKQ